MRVLSKLSNGIRLLGIDPSRMKATLGGMPRYFRDAQRYRKAAAGRERFPFRWRDAKPITMDYYDQAGSTSGHYFHQDLWAARRIYHAHPARHLDIGSRIDGFVAHVLSFMPVEVIDIRPLTSNVPGLTFVQAD